jgi:flagellar FliJ protein
MVNRETRLERMQRVGSLRKGEEQRAGKVLAEAQQERQRHEQLLQQLLGYQLEYRELFLQQSAKGIDVQQYQNFQKFFRQLDAAITEQRQAMGVGERNVEQSREQWVEKRQATESLARLSHSLHMQVQEDLMKKEQKQADELSSNRAHQQSRDSRGGSQS